MSSPPSPSATAAKASSRLSSSPTSHSTHSSLPSARGELAHVRLDARALVGEREGRTLGCECLRHGPRDRPSIRHAGDERQLPVEESRHGVPPYRITIRRPLPVLHCGPVGATRLLSAVACAWPSPSCPRPSGAAGDLTVTVSTLRVPPTIERGKPVSFAVTYTVHGPKQRRALATVKLAADRRPRNRYRSPRDRRRCGRRSGSGASRTRCRSALSAGRYRVVATITLVRGKTRIARAR